LAARLGPDPAAPGDHPGGSHGEPGSQGLLLPERPQPPLGAGRVRRLAGADPVAAHPDPDRPAGAEPDHQRPRPNLRQLHGAGRRDRRDQLPDLLGAVSGLQRVLLRGAPGGAVHLAVDFLRPLHRHLPAPGVPALGASHRRDLRLFSRKEAFWAAARPPCNPDARLLSSRAFRSSRVPD